MDYDLDEIFRYINPQMLYVRHLGYRGRFEDAVAAGDPKAMELRDSVRNVEDVMSASPDLHAGAVFKFFPAQSDGQEMLIYGPDGETVVERFRFGRQREGDGMSLVDLRPGRGKPGAWTTLRCS